MNAHRGILEAKYGIRGKFSGAVEVEQLHCGPMSGFGTGKVNAEFFADGKRKVNLICNLGYGDAGKLRSGISVSNSGPVAKIHEFGCDIEPMIV